MFRVLALLPPFNWRKYAAFAFVAKGTCAGHRTGITVTVERRKTTKLKRYSAPLLVFIIAFCEQLHQQLKLGKE